MKVQEIENDCKCLCLTQRLNITNPNNDLLHKRYKKLFNSNKFQNVKLLP